MILKAALVEIKNKASKVAFVCPSRTIKCKVTDVFPSHPKNSVRGSNEAGAAVPHGTKHFNFFPYARPAALGFWRHVI